MLDGNYLRGNFHAPSESGTVKFISLDADVHEHHNHVHARVPASLPQHPLQPDRLQVQGSVAEIRQTSSTRDGGSAYLNSAPAAAPEATSAGAEIPGGTVTYNHGYTGDLAVVPADNSADLGIRRAWLPLFDRYEVDLVLSGHEHDYERTYPVRGYDAGALGTVVSPNPNQTGGNAVDTRRPRVVTTEAATFNGVPAWDTPSRALSSWSLAAAGPTARPTFTASTRRRACRKPR